MSRRRLNRRASSPQDEALINLMPLIDVVFVVLIMFIVIAPMLDVEQIDLAEGTTLMKEAELKQNFSVYVKADNSIWLNKKQVSFEELQFALLQAHQQSPQSSFQVFHDHRASFGTYQEIRDIGQKAGYEHMDVILKPH